jgi:hypothetical protein
MCQHKESFIGSNATNRLIAYWRRKRSHKTKIAHKRQVKHLLKGKKNINSGLLIGNGINSCFKFEFEKNNENRIFWWAATKRERKKSLGLAFWLEKRVFKGKNEGKGVLF